ncbi:hypothetical protein KQX54_002705 [Cotesia glomerata]|uniref:EB domain-containing protein n=1 Tax=Cotesia glomerata TaxID=32391 RepID=A0AAV7IPA0_COTGL|nr:hypothetical protein KQX54_002705 [Cotesia glomerata]
MYTYVLILQLVAVSSVLAVRGEISTIKNLKYPCSKTSDCGVEYAYCHDGYQQCVCYESYWADDGLCVRYAAKVGESCASSFLVCKGIKNSYCSTDNKCECLWGYTKVHDNKCYPTLNGTCVFNSFLTEGSCYGDDKICSEDSKCICKEGYVQHMRECVKKVDFGKTCSSDIQCAHLPHSYCNTTCKCRPTYLDGRFYDSTLNKCVKGLDAPCEVKTDCGYYFMDCTNRRCQCNSEHYEVNDSCRIKVTQLNATCYHYNDCAVPNSMCYNKQCRCDWNYFEEGGKCVKGLHAPCILDDECKKNNSEDQVLIHGPNTPVYKCKLVNGHVKVETVRQKFDNKAAKYSYDGNSPDQNKLYFVF